MQVSKNEFPLSDQIQQAWQKCEDAWQAVGAPLPCYEENYMKARAELAALHEMADKKRVARLKSDAKSQ